MFYLIVTSIYVMETSFKIFLFVEITADRTDNVLSFFSLCKLLVWLSFRKDIDSRALILARCFKSVFSEGFFRLKKKKTHPSITKIINVDHEGERGRIKEYTLWDCFHLLG